MKPAARLLATSAILCLAVWLGTSRLCAENLAWVNESEQIQHADQIGSLFYGSTLPASFVISDCDIAGNCPSACGVCCVCVNRREWQLLPDGLLWHSYLAGPHEPRISTVIYHDKSEEVLWDITLGGRVGLIRYGTVGSKRPQGWQWDLEGAVMTRLDMLHAQDVESMDYRGGTEITWAGGPWAMKFGYVHISSHVGDEYLIRNQIAERTNYVTESLIWGVSYSPAPALRLYGEAVNSFRASGGAKRYQFQTGIEYTPLARRTWWGAPFAACNLNFLQAVDYDVSTTVQIGWGFQSPETERRFRVGVQYADGPSNQYSFFERRESYFGGGVWFDY